MIPIRKIAVKYGLVLGGILATYTYFLFEANLTESGIVSNLDILFIIAVTILAFKEYKHLNKGLMYFGTAFRLGMMIFLISGFIIATFNYLYIEYVNQQCSAMLMDNVHKELEASNLPEGSIDSTMKFLEKYVINSKGIAAINFIIYAIIGLITTVVTGFFMKRNASF